MGDIRLDSYAADAKKTKKDADPNFTMQVRLEIGARGALWLRRESLFLWLEHVLVARSLYCRTLSPRA
jgi:hypothetical protein